MTASRRLLLSGASNVRDLGGYETLDGQITQFVRVFRSDIPFHLSEEDLYKLTSRGIHTIIDLRSPGEQEETPDPYRTCGVFTHYSYSFSDGNANPERPEDVPVIYHQLLSDFHNIRRVMEQIAQDGPILYHCAAGKDRTGIISALLLWNAGVSLEDILADYQVSYTYIRQRVKALLQKHPEYPPFTGRSDSEFMEITLQQFTEKYGTVQDYFRLVGLEETTILRLREKLLGAEGTIS